MTRLLLQLFIIFSRAIIHYYITHMHAKLIGLCSVSLDTRGLCSPSALKVHLWFYFSVWTKPSACMNELRVSISPDIQKQSMKFRHIEHKVVLVIYTSSGNTCSNLEMDQTGCKENAVMKPLIHEKVVKWMRRQAQLSPRIPPELHWKQWVSSRNFHETLCSNSKWGLILNEVWNTEWLPQVISLFIGL